jgi:hypothetical protein
MSSVHREHFEVFCSTVSQRGIFNCDIRVDKPSGTPLKSACCLLHNTCVFESVCFHLLILLMPGQACEYTMCILTALMSYTCMKRVEGLLLIAHDCK